MLLSSEFVGRFLLFSAPVSHSAENSFQVDAMRVFRRFGKMRLIVSYFALLTLLAFCQWGERDCAGSSVDCTSLTASSAVLVPAVSKELPTAFQGDENFRTVDSLRMLQDSKSRGLSITANFRPLFANEGDRSFYRTAGNASLESLLKGPLYLWNRSLIV